MAKTPRRSVALLVAGILVTLLAGMPVHSAPVARRTLLVDTRDTGGLAELRHSGATLLADYGAFTLWQVAGAGPPALAGTMPDDFDLIQLRDRAFDPLIEVPSTASIAPHEGPQFWMIQFAGPIRDAWLDEVRAAGLVPVAYMPSHSYVVRGNGQAITRLERLAAQNPLIRWTGPYQPAYRLAPELVAVAERGGSEQVEVTVQIFRPMAVPTQRSLEQLGAELLGAPLSIGKLTALNIRLPARHLNTVATWADTFNIEPYAVPQMLDERQAQVVAGNLAGGAPGGPGYLAWLGRLGLPEDPAHYPLVAVVDSGIDIGDAAAPAHPAFRLRGDPALPSRIAGALNCTTEVPGADNDGHGTINAGIVGGYATGMDDAEGYAYGQGIAPSARLLGVKIFDSDGYVDLSACDGSFAMVVEHSARAGATITSNSWGSRSSNGRYTSTAQAYDAWTRDADKERPGYQQLLHIFSAGNSGPYNFSIGAPSTAKNVVSVGALASLRPEVGRDGCGVTAEGNANTIAFFSSRGPTNDKRVKPDLVAPGTHIVGPASQSSDFDGSGVCGLPGEGEQRYFPPGQTLYTVSSGTSHAAPAAAGAAALLSTLYSERWRPGAIASPALLKALLLHQPRYLEDGGDDLPGWGQGWGALSLAPLVYEQAPLIINQEVLLDASGQSYTFSGVVQDPAQPLAVSLVWSDAPGSTTSAAYVNDLNLEVTVAGVTYRGNLFAKGYSISGTQADRRNNSERILLPPGATGPVTVRVVAANIAGDGLPGNTDYTDQDFALVATNLGAVVRTDVTGVRWRELQGNSDGVIDPGETVEVTVTMANHGNRVLDGLSGRLRLVSGVARQPGTPASYGALPLAPGATAEATYTVQVSVEHPCRMPLVFEQQLSATGELLSATSFALPIGQLAPPVRIVSSNGPLPIPDQSRYDTSSTLEVDVRGRILDLDVQVDISHPWTGDLMLQLASPEGSEIVLFALPGDGAERGADLRATLFDDEGLDGRIEAAHPPYRGRFVPLEPLYTFDGEDPGGEWQLFLRDLGLGDEGTLNYWAIELQTDLRVCTMRSAVIYLPSVSR